MISSAIGGRRRRAPLYRPVSMFFESCRIQRGHGGDDARARSQRSTRGSSFHAHPRADRPAVPQHRCQGPTAVLGGTLRKVGRSAVRNRGGRRGKSMSKHRARVVALTMALALVAAACSSSSKGGGSTNTTAASTGSQQIDYKALGLWDNGPCDQARPPLKIGLM